MLTTYRHFCLIDNFMLLLRLLSSLPKGVEGQKHWLLEAVGIRHMTFLNLVSSIFLTINFISTHYINKNCLIMYCCEKICNFFLLERKKLECVPSFSCCCI